MEYWDIYDKNKQLTGRKMKRNDWCLKEDEYHLTVLGVIRRPDGKYLITRRVLTKAWAPGSWEVSGGAAQAGESSEEAVRREVLEETGLDVNGCVGGYMFTYHRENPGEGDNYFVDVYRFEKDFKEEDLHLQTEETAAKETAKKAVKKVAETAEKAVKATAKAADKAVKKTAAKKTAAKKSTAKKAELKTEMFLQFAGKEYTEKEILQKVKEIWTKNLKRKVGEMKDVKIYLKPEESAAYYVVNGDTTGRVDL